MTLARKNAQLAQTISVSGNAVGDTLFIPSSGLVNISETLTSNSGLIDYISTDKVQFDTNVNGTLLQGQLGWNSTAGTLDIGLTDTYALHVGEEIHFRIRNLTGSPLYKGQAVSATGVFNDNQRLLVSKYAADGNIREIRFIGLMTENVNDNQSGYTTNFGYIRGVDTRGNVASNIAVGDETWAVGDILYVHPTVSGKLTKVEPKHSISVAIILDVHQNNGLLLVRPTSYGHLDDNHDVSISGAINGQFLQYNSVTDYWVPSSSGNFTSLSVNNTPVSISGHTHTVSNITDFNTSVSGLLPTIANSSDNRILTSIGSSVGMNAESNLTFDGNLLNIIGSGSFSNGLTSYNPIFFFNLPTSDPMVSGQLWNSDGFLKISEGSPAVSSSPTPTPTVTPTVTPTSSVTPTPTVTPTSSVTPTPTVTPTPSPTSGGGSTGFSVSGSTDGFEFLNGTYCPSSTVNSKTSYTYGIYYIYWSSYSEWIITDLASTDENAGTANVYFKNTSNTSTPPTGSGWTDVDAVGPITVSSTSC